MATRRFCDLCGAPATVRLSVLWEHVHLPYVKGGVVDQRHGPVIKDDLCESCMRELSEARAAIVHRHNGGIQ
jgi:hypothetical protein